jgi:hypothetical protein
VVVGATKLHVTEDRLYPLAAVVDELGSVAAATVDARATVPTVVGVEQLFQQYASNLMHRGSHLELRSAHIESLVSAIRKETARYLLDFARELRSDDLGNFFLTDARSTESPSCSWSGRAWQILSFTSINSGTNSWNRRNAAISRSTLRSSVPDLRCRVKVFPCAFTVSE